MRRHNLFSKNTNSNSSNIFQFHYKLHPVQYHLSFVGDFIVFTFRLKVSDIEITLQIYTVTLSKNHQSYLEKIFNGRLRNKSAPVKSYTLFIANFRVRRAV